MKITLKACISQDYYMDDIGGDRFIFSNTQDKEAVDKLRSNHDAILIGAETLRLDNPSLLIKDTQLINNRKQNGLLPQIIKIVLSKSGDLPVQNNFFQQGDTKKVIVTQTKILDVFDKTNTDIITVDKRDTLIDILHVLEKKYNIDSLLVEGGAGILEQFLELNLANSLRVAISPVIFGAQGKTKFIYRKDNYNLKLECIEKLGNMTIQHYSIEK